MGEESRRPKTVLVGEHEYARAPRFSWPGEVVLGDGDDRRVIPGTWQLEWQPRALVRAGVEADALPPVENATEWHGRMAQLMRLAEPGLQLRIARSDASGWQALEVTVPTRPVSVVEFDREAMARVAGASVHEMRVLA